MEKILEIKNLETSFFTKYEVVRAVQDVTFHINEGETFGLVGESGCGKSVLCRSILRLIREPGKITAGSIIYKDKNILEFSEKELISYRGNEIGMIFQEPMTALNPVLSIRDQIFEAFKDKSMSKKDKQDRAVELLKLVGIPSPEQRLKEYPHQFSGGMRQRAMIAIALATQPKILLADEPTTALDVTIQDQIIKLINKLKKELKMSVIVVTHDLGVVAEMCDRVAVMYAGKIMETADTVTLFSKPRHPYTIGLINSIPNNVSDDERLVPIEGNPPNLTNLPKGCPFYPRCTYAEDICKEEMPELLRVEENHSSRCHFVEKLHNEKGLITI